MAGNVAPKRILILAANPVNTERLRLDQEVREIDDGLRRSEHRDQFELVQKWAVRPRDIQRAMLQFKPNIVHFSGHGEGEDGLVFEDSFGNSQLISGAALANLFKLFPNVNCVVLNGCYSAVQAEAIAEHIPYVIGMSQSVSDRAALEFAISFYDALGARKSVEFAYELGCNVLLLENISQAHVPLLIRDQTISTVEDKCPSSSEFKGLFRDPQTNRITGEDSARIADNQNFVSGLLGNDLLQSSEIQIARQLVIILEKITDQQVTRAYQEALPPDAELSRLRANSFTDMVTQLQEFRRLPLFLHKLIYDETIPEPIRQQLNSLELAENTTEQKSQTNLAFSITSSRLQAYLQVVLRPDLSSERLVVNAWLIPDETVTDSTKRYLPLDIDETQKGVSCQIDSVPQVLNQFLDKALQHLAGQRYELTIEFFLPLEYLCADVDTWELNDLFFEDETYLLGAKYPVIVRSQERLDPRYLASRLNQWYANWDRVKSHLSLVPGKDDFEHLSHIDTCNWKQLVKSLKQKLGLKLTCGLTEAYQEELFTCILKAASPIAIWPRIDVPEIDQKSEIDQLVTSVPLLKILKAIRQKREEADCTDRPDTHLGSHLGILWEDPHRLTPDAMAQLRTPGQ
jgi:hypothetical protein